MTIERALAEAVSALRLRSDAPDLDAQWLLLHVLGRTESSWLFTHGDEELGRTQVDNYTALVSERVRGKPVAYLLGFWEFYGRRFAVSEDVLIPRPSTETLVEEALQALHQLARRRHGRQLTLADIGTGSGCVAITLALESPHLSAIYATDISPAALRIAEVNAAAYGVAHKITFLAGDMLEPLRQTPIDLIVSNPPYVPSRALSEAGLADATQGLTFEPAVALDGGPDGQRWIEKLLGAGQPALVEGMRGGIYACNLSKSLIA